MDRFDIWFGRFAAVIMTLIIILTGLAIWSIIILVNWLVNTY